MTNANKTIYIDVEQMKGAIGFIFGKGQEVVYTGKIIEPMSISNKKERVYGILADSFDVNFIFEKNVLKHDFYPVPKLTVFAVDSCGGCFCTTNNNMSMKEECADIYYIDKNLKCIFLASNLNRFMSMLVFCASWREDYNIDTAIKTQISTAENEYLIEYLKLKNLPLQNKVDTAIVIYPSFEDAKKYIEFYNVTELLAKMDRLEQETNDL